MAIVQRPPDYMGVCKSLGAAGEITSFVVFDVKINPHPLHKKHLICILMQLLLICLI